MQEAAPEAITTYQYDLQGSLIKEQSTDFCKQYLYNDFHQCIQTDIIRGREESAERLVQQNLYDGEGLRFAIVENGNRTGFITDGWDNVTELDGNGRVRKRIIRGLGIVASEDTEESADTSNVFTASYHYYHGNERMDVEHITDESGNVVNSYAYDAFGAITASAETIPNRYTYNGEAYDKATEQYYLRKRYYNPKLCRFTQEDEYRGDGLNLYAFCANNPVMYVDSSGYARAPKPPRAEYALGDTPQAIYDAKNGINIAPSNEYAFIMLNGSNPKDAGVINVLKKNGLDGIWYRDGRPDFTPVASFNVPIENMSDNRTGKGGNYEQARKAIANEIMGANGNINTLIQRGVISDYATAYTKKQVQKFLRSDEVKSAITNNDFDAMDSAIMNYIKQNKLVVHEVNCKDTQLVPREINGRFNHDGGVSDTKNEKINNYNSEEGKGTSKCTIGK